MFRTETAGEIVFIPHRTPSTRKGTSNGTDPRRLIETSGNSVLRRNRRRVSRSGFDVFDEVVAVVDNDATIGVDEIWNPVCTPVDQFVVGYAAMSARRRS
jgi:hypothetical protein